MFFSPNNLAETDSFNEAGWDGKLANKRKIRGRLGALTDSGFELQHAGDGKIVTEVVAFDRAKSVKVVRRGLNVVTKVIIATLIIGAVGATIAGVVFATSEK
jgi:hypothetical protein